MHKQFEKKKEKKKHCSRYDKKSHVSVYTQTSGGRMRNGLAVIRWRGRTNLCRASTLPCFWRLVRGCGVRVNDSSARRAVQHKRLLGRSGMSGSLVVVIVNAVLVSVIIGVAREAGLLREWPDLGQ